MTAAEKQRESADDTQVFDWRFEQLVRAGYTAQQARLLAAAQQVDLHFAERLLANGCTPATAERILL